MTEASSKGVMRLKPTMFLFVRLVCIWMSGCQAQEQKVEKLITASKLISFFFTIALTSLIKELDNELLFQIFFKSSSSE